MGRRAAFFFGAAVVCFLLVPLSDGYAWVAATVGGVYTAFGLASWLDARGRAGGSERASAMQRAWPERPGADRAESGER
jgi:hypothetical protein